MRIRTLFSMAACLLSRTLLSSVVVIFGAGALFRATELRGQERPEIVEAEPPDTERRLLDRDQTTDSLAFGSELFGPSGTEYFAVAAEVAGSGCSVAVATRSGDVHLYDGSVEPDRFFRIKTVPPGHRTSIEWVTFGPTGDVYVSDLASGGTMARYDRDGDLVWAHPIPEPPPGRAFASQLAVSPEGMILNHWFSTRHAVVPGPWNGGTPLVRIYSQQGEKTDSIRGFSTTSGEVLPAALNSGRVFVDGDTAWFVNKAAATATAFVETSQGWSAARRVEFPVFYHMRPPREYHHQRRPGVGFLVENHVLDVDRVPGHGFVLSQAFAYQAEDYEAGRVTFPRTMITAFDNEGHLLGMREPGAVIGRLAANRELIVVVEWHRSVGRTRVRVVPNPFWEPDRSDAGCWTGFR